VAEQLYSAAEYLVRMGHAMWDLHEGDIVVEGSFSPHLTILGIFMEPSPILGLLTNWYWIWVARFRVGTWFSSNTDAPSEDFDVPAFRTTRR
jgi:hypothetical protein